MYTLTEQENKFYTTSYIYYLILGSSQYLDENDGGGKFGGVKKIDA